jgi:hypothetical protein
VERGGQVWTAVRGREVDGEGASEVGPPSDVIQKGINFLDLAVDQVDFARTLVVVACLLVWIAGKMKDVFLSLSFHQVTCGHVELPDEDVTAVGPVVVEALDPDVAVQITVAQSSQRNGELGPDGVEGVGDVFGAVDN